MYVPYSLTNLVGKEVNFPGLYKPYWILGGILGTSLNIYAYRTGWELWKSGATVKTYNNKTEHYKINTNSDKL